MTTEPNMEEEKENLDQVLQSSDLEDLIKNTYEMFLKMTGEQGNEEELKGIMNSVKKMAGQEEEDAGPSN